MILRRIPELSIKFTEKPQVPAQGKKVTLTIESENGIVVVAEANAKTIRKQLRKVEEYEDWVGSLSGKIEELTPNGQIRLSGDGVQIFEKKKKEQPPQEQQPQSEAA